MKNFISGDYYATLGVEKSAHQDEIKRAYRKAVLDCHPDHHPGDKGAEEEFKRVSEAWGILGDADRRRHYDLVAGLIGPGAQADDAVNGFIEAFGKIINEVRGDFEKSEAKRKKTAPKKTKKRRKKATKKNDDEFMILKQGRMEFKVRRKHAG